MLYLRGYALLLLPWIFWSGWEWRRTACGVAALKREVHKIRNRLREPLPKTFVVIWLLSLIGGAIWASTYVDSLSYLENGDVIKASEHPPLHRNNNRFSGGVKSFV